jgi:hypothetical protein
MTGQADIVAPQAASAGNPDEDQRRDEVLCRLLNTPYRPIDRPRAQAPAAEPPRASAADITVKA